MRAGTASLPTANPLRFVVVTSSPLRKLRAGFRSALFFRSLPTCDHFAKSHDRQQLLQAMPHSTTTTPLRPCTNDTDILMLQTQYLDTFRSKSSAIVYRPTGTILLRTFVSNSSPFPAHFVSRALFTVANFVLNDKQTHIANRLYQPIIP